MPKKVSSIVLIRGGEGIAEPKNLPDTIAAMFEIDSTVPLRNRNLVPDGRTIFDLDFYIPPEVIYYSDAEARVQAHKQFGEMYATLKESIFKAYPLERDNWDEIRIQRIDAHGAGALWIQGVLKVFMACIGRAHEPTKRDLAETVVRQVETRGVFKGQVRVSLLADLLKSLVEYNPDEIGLVCGAFGGTGPSVSAVLGAVLSDLKYNVVRVQLVSMPDAFMVNGHTPAEVANRLAAVIEVLQPLALYAGLGQDGVFWHFLGQHMRTIGERFSNVVAKKIAFGAAPAITVIGVPFRSDLQERWLVGQTALNRISENEARLRLLDAKTRQLVAFDTVPFEKGYGVQVRVLNPKTVLLWQWELLLPALATARSGIGNMLLSAEFDGDWFWSAKVIKEVPVAAVPEMDKILKRAGVKSVDLLSEAIAFWALTHVEREMLQRCRQLSFEKAFAQIEANFVQTSREIVSELIFGAPLFPPQSSVFETPADAFFMWGQVNAGTKALADMLCHYFAKVDRSKEEREALEKEESARQARVFEVVAEQLAKYDTEESES